MKRRSAFTVVEVMVSLGVMTIGSMAIIGMQQQTTRANVRARELSTAMQIAQTWIERLKLDGTRWSAVGDSSMDLAQTSFLGVNGGNGTPGGLFTQIAFPAGDADLAASGMSNAFDYYGNDQTDVLTTGAMGGNPNADPPVPAVYYCASYRLSWVFRNVATNPPSADRALRADVRVWWPNETGAAGGVGGSGFAAVFAGCADDGVALTPAPAGGGGAAGAGTQVNNYHVVYLSTVIRPMQ